MPEEILEVIEIIDLTEFRDHSNKNSNLYEFDFKYIDYDSLIKYKKLFYYEEIKETKDFKNYLSEKGFNES